MSLSAAQLESIYDKAWDATSTPNDTARHRAGLSAVYAARNEGRETAEGEVTLTRERYLQYQASEARARDAETALVNLTCNGSEFYLRDGDGFRVDVPACVAYIRKVKTGMHATIVGAIGAKKNAEARGKALEEGLQRIIDNADREDPERTDNEWRHGYAAGRDDAAQEAAALLQGDRQK